MLDVFHQATVLDGLLGRQAALTVQRQVISAKQKHVVFWKHSWYLLSFQIVFSAYELARSGKQPAMSSLIPVTAHALDQVDRAGRLVAGEIMRVR